MLPAGFLFVLQIRSGVTSFFATLEFNGYFSFDSGKRDCPEFTTSSLSCRMMMTPFSFCNANNTENPGQEKDVTIMLNRFSFL